MKEAGLHDPLATALRVKDLARELAEGYRRSTRHVRLRAAILGSWALLSAAAVWASCPAMARTNALGAKVDVVLGSLLGTQVSVENTSDRIWTDVALTLDGGWRYDRKTIRPGDRPVLSVRQFKKDGRGAPEALRPRSLTIECEQGRAVVSVAEE